MPAIILHPTVLAYHPLLYPIFSPLRLLRSALASSLLLLLDALVFLGVLYALLHRTGVLKRIIRKFAEYQLGKVCLYLSVLMIHFVIVVSFISVSAINANGAHGYFSMISYPSRSSSSSHTLLALDCQWCPIHNR